MKKWALCFCVLLLTACQADHTAIRKDIEEELTFSTSAEPIYYTTMSKPLYSYYLPKDVGRLSSNHLSSLLIRDGVKFIMNFNPNEIVIHDFYKDDIVKMSQESKINTDDIYFEASGSFKGSDSRYHDYKCEIYEFDDGNYLLLLNMEYVNYIALAKPLQLEGLIHSMFVIAKSMKFDADEVIARYSLKSTSEKIIQDLEEFNDEIADNGFISDLMEKKPE